MKMINRIQNKVKAWFGQNLGAKIMAILFALFMWIYVMSVINPTINDSVNNIPVQLLNVEELEREGIVLMGEQDHTVNVRVTGRSDQVYRLSRQDIVATADLSGHRNIGANNVQVTVNVDADVEVEFNPRYIRVELEEVVRRQKNVEVNIIGDPASGYVLGSTRTTPSAIWIEGPESNVNAVEAIVAELQLDGQDSNVTANLNLTPVDSRGNEVGGVRLESEAVEVVVPIERTKTVIIEPDLDLDVAEGFVLRNTRVSPRSIMVQGQEDDLENLTRVDTEPIERSELSESETVEVDLLLPDGISLYNERTITVEIEVAEIIEQQYELSSEVIRIENLNEGLFINQEELPPTFTVTVSGPEDVVGNIDSEDIGLLLDLEGLEEGTFSVVPEVEGLEEVEELLVEITTNPETFEVEIIDQTAAEDMIENNGPGSIQQGEDSEPEEEGNGNNNGEAEEETEPEVPEPDEEDNDLEEEEEPEDGILEEDINGPVDGQNNEGNNENDTPR